MIFNYICLIRGFDEPSFQSLPIDDGLYGFSNIAGINKVLSSTAISSSSRKTRTYFSCDIQCTNLKIENCWAFGPGNDFCSGGAIYAHKSSIYMKKIDFNNNKASIGGAISLLSSVFFIDNPSTENIFNSIFNNNAYKLGGGLFLSDSEGLILNLTLNTSICYELGGGFGIYSSTISIEDSIIEDNYAGHSGGAGYVSDSIFTIYNTKIINNSCGNKTYISDSFFNNYYNEGRMDKKSFRFKGGGGFLFYSKKSEKSFISYKCCFNNNKARDIQSDIYYDSLKATGNDILFNGMIHWKSYYDIFSSGLAQNSLGYSSRYSNLDISNLKRSSYYTIFNQSHIPTHLLNYYHSNCNDSVDIYQVNEPTQNLSMRTLFSFSYEERTNVPDPTSPIEINIFPSQTTISYILNPESTRSVLILPSFKGVPTICMTLAKTLMESAHCTPILSIENTLIKTPDDTIAMTVEKSHFQTPLGTFHPTIKNTFKETLSITLEFTPISTPIMSIAQTIIDTLKPTTPCATTPIFTPKLTRTFPSRVFSTIIKTVFNSVSLSNTIILQSQITAVYNFSSFLTFTLSYHSFSTLQAFTFQFTSDTIFYSFYIDEGENEIQDDNTSLVMLIILGFLFLLAIAGCLVYFLVLKKDEDSEKSSIEMNQETVTSVQQESSIAVTNDNPLWTGGTNDNEDDPFKQDFEEDNTKTKLFNI